MVAPSEVQRALGFPDYFNWCTKVEMEAAPDHIRRMASFKWGTADRCYDWDDSTCITYGADAINLYHYGLSFPGWCTDGGWTDSDGAWRRWADVIDCTTVGVDGRGDRVEEKTEANVANRRWCGVRIGGSVWWPSTRLAPAPHHRSTSHLMCAVPVRIACQVLRPTRPAT